jgi:hypothetical protein
MRKAGIDIDQITRNLGDAAAFVQGPTEATLSGAVVIEAKNPTEAQNTVSNIDTLLRANGTPGVTEIPGNVSGFSVRNADLGAQPLVVAAKDERIAVGYGLRATMTGLDSESGATLSKTKAYNEALNSLGSTPITGFAAGAPALRLAESLLSPAEEVEFREARPYLKKIDYIALGSGTDGELATAKLIVGLEE